MISESAAVPLKNTAALTNSGFQPPLSIDDIFYG
jgi:hypothetical protein